VFFPSVRITRRPVELKDQYLGIEQGRKGQFPSRNGGGEGARQYKKAPRLSVESVRGGKKGHQLLLYREYRVGGRSLLPDVFWAA